MVLRAVSLMRVFTFLLLILGALFSVAFWFFVKNQLGNYTEIMPPSPINAMSEVVTFETQDSFRIVGDYYPYEGRKGMILLHMMPADRKSWTAFAAKLQQAGFAVLAIDLRGHGASQGGPSGYRHFSDQEHQASEFDVDAAAGFMKAQGVTEVHLAGASIGANLALEYLVNHKEVQSAILLSPGLNYHGIETEPLLGRILDEQSVIFVASEEDVESYNAVSLFANKLPARDSRKIVILQNMGHGTVILERNPKFINELLLWSARQSRNEGIFKK